MRFWARRERRKRYNHISALEADLAKAIESGNARLGFPSTNPYLGQGPVGSHATTPAPQVHFHINAIDAKDAANFFNEHGATIAAIVNSKAPLFSTGTGRMVRAMAFPP
ncbi:MAG: hypothetical protein ACRD8A_15425 [Candidatus Acidiferrales bacterium]